MEEDRNSLITSIDSERSEPKDAKIESEDISVSQLELMANKKKLNKKSSEISISQGLSEESIKKSYKSRSRGKSSTVSSTNETSSNYNNKRYGDSSKSRSKAAEYENRNDQIRKEKSEFLYKLNKINVKGKWSSLNLDMNNSLEEIKNEYERVRNEIQTNRSVEFCKRMLLLGVQGVEMMNSKFDPLGVDLDGWSEAMGYSMENQEYDEVLAELYEKYKGAGTMSPEVKLIFMIITSATMFTVTKKLTKMDSENMFKNFLGNMMQGQSQQQQQPQYQQQQYQQQQYQQQQYQQQQYQHQQQQYFKNQGNPMPHNADNIVRMDNDSTEEDFTPSKVKAPDVDTIDIDNILKTMSQRKKENERVQEEELFDNSDTTDILKNIPFSAKKKGRGRPPKKVNAKL